MSLGATQGQSRVSTILVVDDELNLVDLLKSYLSREGFEVITASDGLEAVERARSHRPDLIVLDVMLPGIDGIEACRQIRQFSDAYVIMLTARAEEIDKIIGLSVGADDYLTKPFSSRELVARVKAMLRRPRSLGTRTDEPAVVHRFGDLVLDEGRHEVTRSGEIVPLTAREFRILSTLAAHPGYVFTRSQLLEQVWGDDYYDDHVVDVHVANLRKKIEEDPANPRYVETIRGVGYRWTRRAGG